MGEIQQEYICSVTKCTSCCSQLLYHNKDRLVSHSMKVFTQRNRDFPANVECLTTIMLLRRSPSALSHHQSPGWERGHVLARLVGQGHLVLDLPAGRWLPSIVQMLSWKETVGRFGVNITWTGLFKSWVKLQQDVVPSPQKVKPWHKSQKRVVLASQLVTWGAGRPHHPAEPGFKTSQVPTGFLLYKSTFTASPFIFPLHLRSKQTLHLQVDFTVNRAQAG